MRLLIKPNCDSGARRRSTVGRRDVPTPLPCLTRGNDATSVAETRRRTLATREQSSPHTSEVDRRSLLG